MSLPRPPSGGMISSTWQKRAPYYRDIERAERELERLFRERAHPAFVFGPGNKARVADLAPVVARVVDERGWPTFGSDAPPAPVYVEKALRDAGFRVAAVEKPLPAPKPPEPARPPGSLSAKLFASMAGPPKPPKPRKKRVFAVAYGIGVAPPPPEEERVRVTLFRCACGYVTVDATSMKNHGETCERGHEHERLPRAEVRRVEDGGGDFSTSAFVCADPACETGRGRTWLHRQAAYAHGNRHGCELTKTKASFEILERP